MLLADRVSDVLLYLIWNGVGRESPKAGYVLTHLLRPLPLLPFLLIAIAIYGMLTRRYYRDRLLHVDETTCRKCGYILKGIKEPICSECGERI